MGMRTFLLSLGMAMSFIAVLPSCSKESEPVVKQDLAVENSSQKSEEHQLQELFDKQRTLLQQGIRRQRKESQEFRSFDKEEPDDYVFDPEAREKKVKEQPWSEQTKRFYLDLPLYFTGDLPLPSTGDVSQYKIPQEEKVLVTYAMAMVTVARSEFATQLRATDGSNKHKDQATVKAEKIKKAKAACESAYSQELANITTEAVAGATAGGIAGASSGLLTGGSLSLPGAVVGAVFGGVAGAASQAVRAYMHYRSCMNAAENGGCRAVAPNYEEWRKSMGLPPLGQADSLSSTASSPEATTPPVLPPSSSNLPSSNQTYVVAN